MTNNLVAPQLLLRAGVLEVFLCVLQALPFLRTVLAFPKIIQERIF